jgi:Fur family peroxide stress response transcriptional regulator
MKTRRQPTEGAPLGAELAQRLRAHRFKLTPQRAAVYRAVREMGHVTPKQIHAAVRQAYPMLSLNTVYATLETLERIGQILRVTGPEGSNVYEAASPIHHHFHCLGCGRILDVHDPTLDSIPLPPSSWAQFTVTTRRVEFYGYCPGCRRRLGSTASSQETPPAPARSKTTQGGRTIQPRGRTTRAGPR